MDYVHEYACRTAVLALCDFVHMAAKSSVQSVTSYLMGRCGQGKAKTLILVVYTVDSATRIWAITCTVCYMPLQSAACKQ